MGTVTGTSIDMVAQEDPVAKLINAAVTNVMGGSSAGVKKFFVASTIYSAVLISAQISPMVQARIKIIQARIMERAPSIQASMASRRLSSPRIMEIPMATNPDRNEPHMSAVFASDAVIILINDRLSPGFKPCIPVTNKPPIVIAKTSTIGITALLQWDVTLASIFATKTLSIMGWAFSDRTAPVVCARVSAFSMGPNSFFINTVRKRKTIAMMQ